ncbi:hypothetical protein COB57_06280 [Candidatus Peregrinibacteria bacterium]|nr:MAG: hypothetical protein COB57_06280 [Candidatus Peregrinibacteria bacterium]
MKFLKQLFSEIPTPQFPRHLFFYLTFAYLALFSLPQLIEKKHIWGNNFIPFSGELIVQYISFATVLFLLSEIYHYFFHQDQIIKKSALRKLFFFLFFLFSSYEYILALISMSTPLVIVFFCTSLLSILIYSKDIKIQWINRVIFITSCIFILSLPGRYNYTSENSQAYILSAYVSIIESEIMPETIPIYSAKDFIDPSIEKDNEIDSKIRPAVLESPEFLYGQHQGLSYKKVSDNEAHICIPDNISIFPLSQEKNGHCISIKRFLYSEASEQHSVRGISHLLFLTLISHE